MFRKLLLLSLFFFNTAVSGQDHRILDLDDHRYTHIQRLQERGHLLDLNPTALPYTYGEVAAAAESVDSNALSPAERRWLSLILDDSKDSVPEDHVLLFGEAGGGLNLTNSKRLDVVRPVDDDLEAFQRLYVKAAAVRGRWVGQVGLVHDGYYDRDPDGLDSALRAQSRAENGYLGFQMDPVAIYLGRFSNHWGTAAQNGLAVSNNARAYDQINLRFGGSKYSFRSFYAELDAITGDGRFTGTAGADSVSSGLERRFLFAHRFDIRPNENLTLSIMESILISGASTGFSLRFLNPFTAVGLENDNVPKNDENNALLGLMLWARIGTTTIHSQVIMDDLDVLNLGSERTSVAGTAYLRHAFRARPLDIGLSSTVVASRTYNTHQPEGQYVYLLRGLALQYNDFAHISAELNWFADSVLPGLVVSPRLHLLKQGEQRITATFPKSGDNVETLLSGIVETTRRASLVVEFQPNRYWWISVDAGMNSVGNAGHIEGATDSRFSGLMSFGIRIPIRGSDVLDL
ncbi:MAG: hypothetical protein HKN43_03625 [Rhodothermales bacterium]|nr:hypothetical protein [Rhodothermales bacterium]